MDSRTVEERFWSFVPRRPEHPDECWIWTGAQTGTGYGEFMLNYKPRKAHRVAFQLTYGLIPKGMFICHDCPKGDNPLCVRPTHLWSGTPKANSQDAVKKGRIVRGEHNIHAKLTELDVIEIRRRAAAGDLQYQIAKDFKVSKGTISEIVSGKNWRHR